MASADDVSKLIKEGVPILDGRFWLRVSPDRLEAYLKCAGEIPVLTPEDKRRLKEELPKQGIVYGLLEAPVYQEDRIVVARGTPPVPGKDAHIKLLVDLSRGPKEEGNRVDFREQNAIVCVRAGQKVIEKIPPTQGTPGHDVLGQTIPASPGKDIPLRAGPGLVLSSDGRYLIAEKDGVLFQDGSKYRIFPSFVLNADVDWDVGNIRFYGEKLTINGDVRRGFKIKCKGDLEINGRVEDEVKIEVKGELRISGVVQGERTRLKCLGNAYLSIVEYAHVEVNGHLSVSEYLLNAYTQVGKCLRLPKEAKIIGGEYYVRESIVAGHIGSSAHVNTLVRAGFDKDIESQLQKIRAKKILLEEHIRKIGKILRSEKELRQKDLLDPKKEKLLRKLKISYSQFMAELLSLEEKEKNLSKLLKTLREAIVQVFDQVYPGTEIWIADQRFLVVRPLKSVIFYRKGPQIVYRFAH